MKILIINPNSDLITNSIIESKANEVLEFNKEVTVEVVNCENTPKLIGKYLDYQLAADEMIEMVSKNQHDAYIIACHSDPNIDVIREITDKPVIGIGEASMRMASIYGNSFVVISPSIKSITRKRGLTRKYYIEDMFIGTVVSTGDTNEEILEAAKKAVANYNPDSIVLGCANYALADRYVENIIKTPVFDGVATAIYFVTGMYNYQVIKKNKTY